MGKAAASTLQLEAINMTQIAEPVSLLDGKKYTSAAATNVMATFRQLGWTPPSELNEFQQKWSKFRSEHLTEWVSQ